MSRLVEYSETETEFFGLTIVRCYINSAVVWASICNYKAKGCIAASIYSGSKLVAEMKVKEMKS